MGRMGQTWDGLVGRTYPPMFTGLGTVGRLICPQATPPTIHESSNPPTQIVFGGGGTSSGRLQYAKFAMFTTRGKVGARHADPTHQKRVAIGADSSR